MFKKGRGWSQDGKRCNCGQYISKTRAWTKDNPGRRLYACSNFDADTNTRGCKYFKWIDEEDPTDWQRDVILGLMEDKRQLSNEVEVLKRKLMESVVLERKKDTEKIMLKMKRTRVSSGLKCEVWVICALLAILLFWYFILT
ncbi:uncharacterized protein LOC104886637 [Beta vulgaris subsp. vulgaris]|uniref:uncharacterized protein LOC104886637 n=1 Tax=Beta vulgaris subsp. vulgaris TaxID=3555 RepID=UPI00053F7403|nr:uncharacterized protein LOC104886637 [Beta vulgaris subsp. vulgaris]